MAESLVIGILGMWGLLSVLVLVPRLKVPIRRRDLFMLVPEWFFFAPVPGQEDYHLLYRDCFEDRRWTRWTEIPLADDREWWSALWNPRKRASKALHDAVTEFALIAVGNEAGVEASIPYLALLNHVSTVPRSLRPRWTQFLVLQSYGLSSKRAPDMIYRSGLHAL